MFDDRRQPVKLRVLRGRLDPKLVVEVARRRKIAELRSELENVAYRRVLQGIAIGAPSLMVLALVLRVEPGGRPAMLAIALPILGLIAWSALGSKGLWRRELAKLEGEVGALRTEYCIGCGYRLMGLQVGADGCTMCPECGAAWRLAEKSW
jgi:hypothetical protein